MSIKIMAQVWDKGPTDRGELLVLLALADFADDTGRCWPSMATIARKARMEPRSVQRICKKLTARGWLTVSPNSARKGCNLYVVTPDTGVTPDTMSPLTPASPPSDARVTPPPTPVSPEPSRTVIEPSVATPPISSEPEGRVPATAREALLSAMGIDSTGIAGPSAFLGGTSDVVEAERWSGMGLSLST